MGPKKQNLDFLSMSDEEFSQLPPPTVEAAVEEEEPKTAPPPAAEEPEEVEEEEEEGTPASAPEKNQETAEDPDEEPEPEEEPEGEEEEEETPPAPAPEKKKEKEESKIEKPAEEKPEEIPPTTAEAGTLDYKKLYEQVMAPFQANGKTIQLKSPEDAISLMQMGANYTQKMQGIAKYRKLILMLENSQMLDESKLSFAIDLLQKNPEAIRKLIQDAKIDPIDIDVSSESTYKGGSHVVSDQEVAVTTTIREISNLPGGAETIQSINKWDKASQKMVWDNPQILTVLHAQRSAGIYAQVEGEVERRQMLGQIPTGTPFLAAYRSIGEEMTARGAFGPPPTQPATQAPPPVVRTTPVARTVSPATKGKDNQKVRAAAPPRTAPNASPKAPINYLAMSDEEFAKHEELLRKMGTR